MGEVIEFPEKYTEQLNIRLTKSQYAEINARAEAAGVPNSILARSIITGDLPKMAKARAAADAPELARMLGILAGLKAQLERHRINDAVVTEILLNLRHQLLMALSGQGLHEITEHTARITKAMERLAMNPANDNQKLGQIQYDIRVIAKEILRVLRHDYQG